MSYESGTCVFRVIYSLLPVCNLTFGEKSQKIDLNRIIRQRILRFSRFEFFGSIPDENDDSGFRNTLGGWSSLFSFCLSSLANSDQTKLTPVAGLLLRQKSSDIFLRAFFGRGIFAQNSFSVKKCRSILSNQVISWYGSRAVGCPLGREFSAKTCSLLFMNPSFMKFLHWTCSLLLWFMIPPRPCLGQVVLVPQAQEQPVPICLCHRDQVPWPILGSSLIKDQRGPNRISEIPDQKSVKKARLKIDFFHFFCTKLS